MKQIEEFRKKLTEGLEEDKGKIKAEYGRIRELAELIGDTDEYADSPAIREKVLTIIHENEIERFRGMNHSQLTSLAESIHGRYRGLTDALNAIYNA